MRPRRKSLRLYMDMDSLSGAVVRELRSAGFDVLTAAEAGNRLLSDEAQLKFRSTDARAVYTANLADFARLHAQWMRHGQHHHGIIVRVNQQVPVGQQLRSLQHLVAAMPSGLGDVLA